MSQHANSPPETSTEHVNVTEHQVVEYLRRHPEFFERHASLLAELRVPHKAKGAVSLVERQQKALRDQNRELQHKLHELVEIAHANDALHARMHQLIVAVLQSGNLEQMRFTLTQRLHEDFNADTVAWYTVSDDADDARDELAPLLAAGAPVCGPLKPALAEWLFGDMADAVASAALLPLGSDTVLAIGAHDAGRFSPDTSTDYLAQLGAVLGIVLERLRNP